MDNDKNTPFDNEEGNEEETANPTAQRARNRTVMLTPDITGEVRARLAQDIHGGDSEAPAPYRGPAFGGGQSETVSTRPSASFGGYARPEPPAPAPAQPAYTPPAAPSRSEPAAVAGGDRIVWMKKGPIVGFLVSFDRDDNGEVFPLRTGRLIVTSEASTNGNFLIVADQTVSPMHAILRMSASGEVQVLDQLSEHGTRVIRFGGRGEDELSGDKGNIEHGDVVCFGERKFHVCILLREAVE